jgi:hypothetical protein
MISIDAIADEKLASVTYSMRFSSSSRHSRKRVIRRTYCCSS